MLLFNLVCIVSVLDLEFASVASHNKQQVLSTR